MDLESLRLAVYSSFRHEGQPPLRSDLARGLAVSETEVDEGLRTLHDQRHLVLGDDGNVVMAHPFSAVPLGFSVMGKANLWWGGCSWDAFAIPHLLPEQPDVLVATRCPGCGRAGAWVVDRVSPPDTDWIAHFLVPVARMWDDVVHTCGHQRMFCSSECVDAWLGRTGNELGYVMDAGTLWRLASHWYDGRLERGYTRREPSAARAYFRSVGLDGPFWTA